MAWDIRLPMWVQLGTLEEMSRVDRQWKSTVAGSYWVVTKE
jgi:hypothetical protein